MDVQNLLRLVQGHLCGATDLVRLHACPLPICARGTHLLQSEGHSGMWYKAKFAVGA